MIHRPDTSAWAVPTDRPEDWRDRGLCRAHPDPDLWYATAAESHGARVDQAVAICVRCPVLNLCAQWALETAEPWGVWGGLTAGQRARMRGERAPEDPDTTPTPRRRARPDERVQCGTEADYQQHKAWKERVCAPCRDAHKAHLDAHPEERKPRGCSKRQPMEHGTVKGVRQHRYRGEKPCADCLTAERADQQQRRLEKAAAA